MDKKNLKVLILTMPLGENIGGLFQAAALQQMFRQLGCDVVTINVKNHEFSFVERCKNLINRSLSRVSETLPTKKDKQIYFENLYEFKLKNISLTNVCCDQVDVFMFMQKYQPNLLVVGSDQVWRPGAALDLNTMFLDGPWNGTVRKIAYAASFGVSNPQYTDSEISIIRHCLKDFFAISVRERSGIKWLEKNCKIEARLVLDPVFFLDIEHKFSAQESTHNNNKYIATYFLDKNPQINHITEEISSCLGLPSIPISPEKKIYDCHGVELERFKYPKMDRWLIGIRDSSFVLTDSFHGAVFAIIFNRPFLVIGNHYRGLSRIYSLLQVFQLTDRIVFDACQVESVVASDIDWDLVNRIVEDERAASMHFLNKVISI